MDKKLYDSERKILEILWREGELPAKKIAQIAKEEIGWSRTTTYTVIKKCLEKEAIQRREPGFYCKAAVSRQKIQQAETKELIDRMFGGMADGLVASLLDNRQLSKEAIGRLKEMIEEMDEEEGSGSGMDQH